jgi:hypothetical protein
MPSFPGFHFGLGCRRVPDWATASRHVGSQQELGRRSLSKSEVVEKSRSQLRNISRVSIKKFERASTGPLETQWRIPTSRRPERRPV